MEEPMMSSTLSYDLLDWTTGITSQADDDDLSPHYDVDYDDWSVPKPLKTLYTVLFATVFTIGVVGNTLVIIVILKTKEMRNSTNILLVNLSFADILTVIVLGTDRLYNLKTGLYFTDISPIFCFAVDFLSDTVIYASVLTILAISIERYYAVCHPLKVAYICTNRRAYITCLLVWTLAALFCSLRFSFTHYVPEPTGSTDEPPSQPGCWEQDSPLSESYYIISALVLFVLPLFVFIVLFTIIIRHLNFSVIPYVNVAAIRHRRRVTKMLATVVLCFVLCQLPQTVFNLLYAVACDELDQLLGVRGYNNVLYFCQFMLYIHSAINPVLYNVMSERFRTGFKNIFSGLVSGCSRWQQA